MWAVVAPLVDLPLAFVLALILHAPRAVRAILPYRVVHARPHVLPGGRRDLAVGLTTTTGVSPTWSCAPSASATTRQAWLASPVTALPALILVTTWMFAGFNMVVAAGGHARDPCRLPRCRARVDGAGAWQRTLRIMVPLLWPTHHQLVILDFIGKMKQFALVWVMTRGGPMWGTETVATYVVKRAFEWKTLDLGYPSAIAVIWFVIIFGLSLLLTRVLQRRDVLEF